jgi:hypothetical protein
MVPYKNEGLASPLPLIRHKSVLGQEFWAKEKEQINTKAIVALKHEEIFAPIYSKTYMDLRVN